MGSYVRAVFFLLFFQIISFSFFAESFRVGKVHIATLSPSVAEEEIMNVGINESVAVFMPQDMTFIEGFELKVKIPQIVADWRDSVAFSLYNDIKPTPDISSIDYSGNRIFVVPLPAKLNWIVQIPLKKETSIKENSYVSKVDVIPNVSSGYAFIRFQPAMKGVPDETYEAKLTVLVKPVLINKGCLSLSVLNPEGNLLNSSEYEVFIDDETADFRNGKVLLSCGKHNISVQSETFRNEVRSFYIEQAKTSEITVNLKSLTPTLTVTAPENSEVYIDDEKLNATGKEFEIKEGEHIIKCKIGSYEVVRSILVEKGKSYSANLMVDLEIVEE